MGDSQEYPLGYLSVSLDRHAAGCSIQTTIKDADELAEKLELLIGCAGNILEFMAQNNKYENDGGCFV